MMKNLTMTYTSIAPGRFLKTAKRYPQEYCSYMEIGNHFWEYEDNCTLNNGIDIDILYREPERFASEIEAVAGLHQAHNGYTTTCMWHNLLHSRILYDKAGWLTALKTEI